MKTTRMERPDYRIYPSLLQAYQNLLDYQTVAEEDWNKVSESAHERGEYLDRDVGDYKLTPDEMYLKLEADLIDSINRLERKPNEAADKGTAFNEIVDCLIEHRGSSREDCVIKSVDLGEAKAVKADINGFTFYFDIGLCKYAAEQFKGSLPQFLAEATMMTKFGSVQLYGFIDEWVGPKMYDIKTTGRYSWPKFDKGWQRYVYPWCVIESGLAESIDSFTYWIVEWSYQKKGVPLTAKGIYTEEYDYNHDYVGMKIKDMLESFIDWLESRREFIQDKRIFGGDNPKGWHGTPVDISILEKVIFKTTA